MRLIAGLAGGEVGFAFREARARPERAAGEHRRDVRGVRVDRELDRLLIAGARTRSARRRRFQLVEPPLLVVLVEALLQPRRPKRRVADRGELAFDLLAAIGVFAR
jgi:hypothetical protein